MDKVLVTGATGVVGSNLVSRLLAAGRPVVALARDAGKAKRLLPDGCLVIAGDVTNKEDLRRAVRGVSSVYHAAGIPEQWLPDPRRFFAINTEGTRNLATVCLERGVRRFVYVSTVDVFSPGPDGSYDEEDIDPSPKATPYQRSKQEADRLVAALVDEGLPAVFIHPAAVFGPELQDSRGLNAFLRKLAFGWVPLVPPGAIPVVFAPDLAWGCTRAEELARPGDRFILSESTLTFQEIARVVTDQRGRSSRPRTMPLGMARAVALASEGLASVLRRPPLLHLGQLTAAQSRGIPCTARAEHILGWRPTPFPMAVARTLRHFEEVGARD